MNLTFDADNHRYFSDGKPVLSVTQYLKLAGFIDDEWFTEASRQRGSAVHTAIHYINENDLDRNSLHPIVRPYVDAYDKFVFDTNFKTDLVEHRIYDEVYGYAGTLDVTGTWNLSDGNILIDFKTGEVYEHCALQTAAYDACLQSRHKRFGLRLKPDGSYRLTEEYKDRNDIKIFRSLVATVNWRIQRGLLVPDEILAA